MSDELLDVEKEMAICHENEITDSVDMYFDIIKRRPTLFTEESCNFYYLALAIQDEINKTHEVEV